jgi:uncharacterized protein
MEDHRARPHFPGRAAIDAYGAGGFRFADMSHRGSILCIPSGIYAFEPTRFSEIDEKALAPVLAESGRDIAFLLIGCGPRIERVPESLRVRFRAVGIGIDAMDTGAACRTYNVMLAERRPVAAALLAVE